MGWKSVHSVRICSIETGEWQGINRPIEGQPKNTWKSDVGNEKWTASTTGGK